MAETTREARAAALSFEEGDPAPRALAIGAGREAERIVALARDAGIPIVEDPALAALLEAELASGEYIPPWCWDAVAKILAFVLAEEHT